MPTLEDYYHCLSPKFPSGAHTQQNRLFGFITTNIRHIGIITKYINDLVPVWIKFKDNEDYDGWKTWCYEPENQQENKQKHLRLETAKILWRDVDYNPEINRLAEIFYDISDTYGREYLDIVLSLYLMTGRYWNVNCQPLVAYEKIISNFNGDIATDFAKIVAKDYEKSKLFLSTVFYNPRCENAINLAFEILATEDDYSSISEKVVKKEGQVSNRFKTNTRNGFIKEALYVYNYHLFEKSMMQGNLASYINDFVGESLYAVFDIEQSSKTVKENMNSIINLIMENNILQELGLNKRIETDKRELRTISAPQRNRKSNLKEDVFQEYDYKCFFESYETHSGWHEKGYFEKENGIRYLEAHHLIPMKNSRFFSTSLDVKENLLPLCPNCHCKIHHAKNETIKNMLKKAYDNINEDKFIEKGIFVSLNKLHNFYDLEND